MSTTLLSRLNEAELARAELIPLFANESRLARKPRCSMTKSHSIVRSAANAVVYPYIQPNSPMAYARIVYDLDWDQRQHRFHNLPLRFLAEAHAWEDELGVPEPSWVALSKDKNSGHIGYELETPVGRHENARIKPQKYLTAVKSGLGLKLGADEGFTGQLCKNPLHSSWDFYKGANHAFDLHELAEYVELTSKNIQTYNREPRGEIGRNVFLFDEVRFWSYDNIRAYRTAGYEAWEQAVITAAEHINASSYDHIPTLKGRGLLLFSECKSIGRSVAKWTWANHGSKTNTPEFSELQSRRAVLGAVASAKMKRERRESQIIDAIGQLTSAGKMPTMGQVALLIGCSKQAISAYYGHLFPSTLH